MQPEQTIQSPYAARAGIIVNIPGLREIFGSDLRTLALFRVGLGALLLVDLALRARDLTAHYTDAGILPRAALLDTLSVGSFSLHLLNGTVAFQVMMFIVAAVFALMLMLGSRTRLATIASWVLLLSLQNRNPQILSAGDSLILLLSFWSMFLPLGARYSVDAALDRQPGPVRNSYFTVATLALLIQGASMYLFGALLKSDAQWIPDGPAVYYALQLDYMVTPFGLWLRQFPDLLQGLTFSVWWLEIVGPILIFSPIFHRTFRTLCLGAFITLNLGLFLCLELGLFPLVSLVMNLAFVPGWMWDRMAGAIGRSTSPDLRIFYDEDCVFCHKICRLLTIFLMMPGIPIRPAQSDPKAAVLLAINNSWVVSDGADTDYLEWDAVRHLMSSSPLFRPLATLLSVSPLQILGNKFYQWVARNRSMLGRFGAVTLPWRQSTANAGPVSNATAGLFLAFVIFQNLTTLPEFSVRMPAELKALGQTTGLYQNWTLFAPHPELKNAWPVILGELKDNRVVDVYHRRAGIPGWDKPEHVAAIYKNNRWRTYLSSMENISHKGHENSLALNYARYLCRSWNETAPPGKELSVFNIYFNVEWSRPDYQKDDATNRLIWSHDCFASG